MTREIGRRPRAPRVPLDAALTFWRDGGYGEGRVRNLSATGFFSETAAPAPVGARLEISFTLPHDRSGKIVTGEVIVVRHEDGESAGFGARFFRIPRTAATMIDEFLSRTVRRPA